MNTDDLITIFLKHVSSSPDHLAIMTTDTSLTYQQLFVEVVRWKALFSQHLHNRVIIHLERTPRLLSVILALQWLEITYIPVDLTVPIERLRVIIDNSQAQAILYDAPHHLNYSSLTCFKMDLAHIDRPAINDIALTNYQIPQQHTLAYIIYTSGSTGTPKGVAISRGALNNFLANMSHYFLKGNDELLLAITTVGFDIAVLELFLPLWQQKTLFLANNKQHKDPSSISKLLTEYPITLLQATPAMWSILENTTWAGQSDLVALCGGEPLPHGLAQRLLSVVAELWNMYGPTEATVWCALKKVQANEPITIGHPIDNMEMFVMDSSLKKLPPNVKGELYIGGFGLAVGYVNNDALTQSQFIPYPDVLGGRLYRVGDIACSTSDGELVVFGRTDNQIKLHGYRIELEEIEAQILTLSEVRECAVIVNKEQLIAHICSTTIPSLTENKLINHLSKHLPEYMVPNRVIFLEKLPLTPSGKIDRNVLTNLPLLKTTNSTKKIKLTALQSLVTQIWAEEFHLSTIGINDNFFELGGHSLLAERILLKLEQQTQKQLTLPDLYRSPTIAQFVKVIKHAHCKDQKQRNTLLLKNNHWFPLNDFQFMFWMSSIFEPSLKTLRVTERKRIQGILNKEALDSALEFILQKQDAFSYAINHFYPAQKRLKRKRAPLKWIESSLVDYDDETIESLLYTSYEELNNSPQRLVNAPMIIAKLIHLKNDQTELQVSISHFISDNASMEVFFHDLSNAYLHYAQQSPLNKKQPTQSPISHAIYQKEVFKEHELIDSAFWKDYLQNTGLFSFPDKYIIKNFNTQSFQFSTYIEISELTLTNLHHFCTENSVTISDALCAAIGLSLKICCKDEPDQPHQLVMNNVKSTRDDPSYDDVIGCFLSIHPIKLNLIASNTLESLSQQAQQSFLETAEHQRAASLVKLASIGHLPRRGGLFKHLMIAIAIRIFSSVSHWANISVTLLNACKILSSTDRQKDFFINVNISDNFVSNNHKQHLFDLPCKNIPVYNTNLSEIQHVFDVNFLRQGEKNAAFIVVSANLVPEFRQHFGSTLLDVIGAE